MKITNRRSREYLDGVQQFLNFASNHAYSDGTISCPCKKCVHTNSWPVDVVQAHLVSKGICRGYNPWVFNGESSFAKTSTEIPSSHVQENPIEYADLRGMLHNMFPIQDMTSESMEEVPSVQQPTEGSAEGLNEDALKFMKLLEDANQHCYEGYKYFSKLSAIVHLYHMKCLNGWTNKSFIMLLEFLLDFFPSNAKLPKDWDTDPGNKAQVKSNRPKKCIPEDCDILVDNWYTDDAVVCLFSFSFPSCIILKVE